MTNALPTKEPSGSSISSAFHHMWDVLQGLLVAEPVMEGGVAVVELLIEEEDEEDQRRAGLWGPGFGTGAKVPRRWGESHPPAKRPGGRHPLWSHQPWR